MYTPSYNALECYYYFSPDHCNEFEEWENRLGKIEEWDDDDLYDFVETVTGDKPDKIEFNKQLLFIKYTI